MAKNTKALVSAVLNYAAARKVLRANNDLVGLRYYNSYATCKTLKLFIFRGKDPVEAELIDQMLKTLDGLANTHSNAARGGIIYRFNIPSASVAKKNQARDRRYRKNRKAMMVGGAL